MKHNLDNLKFVSIATNRYLDYWKSQAQSIDKFVSPGTGCTLYLLTNRVQEAMHFAHSLEKITVVPIEIPNYGWPEATLFRYKLLAESEEIWEDSYPVIYLDADMLAISRLSYGDFFTSGYSGICLVKHPGYFRPNGLSLIKLYFMNPEIAYADLIAVIKNGGLGAWETRTSSLAFVNRLARKVYYCGGIWWGTASELRAMCYELSDRVNRDLEQGIIANWHDESHLNWWATHNSFNAKTPEYCFSDSFPALAKLSPKILAVDKGQIDRNVS